MTGTEAESKVLVNGTRAQRAAHREPLVGFTKPVEIAS
jgi:hypothetical protein